MFRWVKTFSKRINALIDGSTYSVEPTHPNYKELERAAERNDAATFKRLADVATGLREYSKGHVRVQGGRVFYAGHEIQNSLTERILNCMRDGIPFEPFVLFLENLVKNPSKRAIKELYTWLAHNDIPITTDGHWLGYKAVREDWMDQHSGTVDNHVGQSPSMPRTLVDDNWGLHCSQGYHVGNWQYASTFGPKMLIVKVNPRDVVSVPDGEAEKCRVSEYTVIAESRRLLDQPVYDAPGPNQPIVPIQNIPRPADRMPAPQGEPDNHQPTAAPPQQPVTPPVPEQPKPDPSTLPHLTVPVKADLRRRAVIAVLKTIQELDGATNNNQLTEAEIKVEHLSYHQMAETLPPRERRKFIDPDYKPTVDDLMPIAFDLFQDGIQVGSYRAKDEQQEQQIINMAKQAYGEQGLVQQNRIDHRQDEVPDPKPEFNDDDPVILRVFLKGNTSDGIEEELQQRANAVATDVEYVIERVDNSDVFVFDRLDFTEATNLQRDIQDFAYVDRFEMEMDENDMGEDEHDLLDRDEDDYDDDEDEKDDE